MQCYEMIRIFWNVVEKNNLFVDNGKAVKIPLDGTSTFFGDFYYEIIHSKECREKKRYYFNYIRKVMRDKEWYINEERVLDFVYGYVHDDADFEIVKMELSVGYNWSNFWRRIEEKFEI